MTDPARDTFSSLATPVATPPQPRNAAERLLLLALSLYVALFGATVRALLPQPLSQAEWLPTVLCAAPLLLLAWVAKRGDQPRKQRLAEALAGGVMPPLLLLMWAELAWPLTLTLVVVHVAAFLLILLTTGTRLTRVAAAPGVAPITPAWLHSRLGAIRQWPGVRVTQDADGGLTVHCTSADDREGATGVAPGAAPLRSHRVRLSIDAAAHCVRVREQITAQGAAPVTAAEADMRPIGTLGYAPTIPDAQRVWSRAVQTRLIDDAQLAAQPLRFDGPQAEIGPLATASALDDAVVPMLCALVTRSGYRWQPVFFGQ